MISAVPVKAKSVADVEFWTQLGAAELANYVGEHPGCTWTDIGVVAKKIGLHRKFLPDVMAFLELTGHAHLTDTGWYPGPKGRHT